MRKQTIRPSVIPFHEIFTDSLILPSLVFTKDPGGGLGSFVFFQDVLLPVPLPVKTSSNAGCEKNRDVPVISVYGRVLLIIAPNPTEDL